MLFIWIYSVKMQNPLWISSSFCLKMPPHFISLVFNRPWYNNWIKLMTQWCQLWERQLWGFKLKRILPTYFARLVMAGLFLSELFWDNYYFVVAKPYCKIRFQITDTDVQDEQQRLRWPVICLTTLWQGRLKGDNLMWIFRRIFHSLWLLSWC